MKKFIYETYKGVSEAILPPLSHSQFKEKGKLTPDEYLRAGDFLVQTCPTWSWEGGDPGKRWDFLPDAKQYLITRNVPCIKRAFDVESYAAQLPAAAPGDEVVEGGEWVATTSSQNLSAEEDAFEELPPLREPGPIPDLDDDEDKKRGMSAAQDASSVPDLSNFNLEAEDDAIAPGARIVPTEQVMNQRIMRTRTYDLLISYDKHGATPRVWLIGYSENKAPLTREEVMEDVIQDYREKTVTCEAHPHQVSAGKVVSIHPCRHAQTMKKLVQVMESRDAAADDDSITKAAGEGEEAQGDAHVAREFKIEHAMILFLKFISSVVPTIEYDFTMPAGM